MVETSSPTNHPVEASVHRTLATVLAPVIVVLALVAFTWPAARLAPRDLPIGFAGPAADVLTARLDAGLAGSSQAIDAHRYPDEAAARAAIEKREIYGAVIAGPGGVTILTASAASPVIAQLLPQTVAAAMAGTGDRAAAAPPTAASGTTTPGASGVRVVDVVPTPAGDPRGAALVTSLLPLILAGMILAGLVTWTTQPGLTQIGILVTASIAVGLAAAGIVQGWLGILGGAWWADSLALASLVLAVAAFAAGLHALFGNYGYLSGAVLFVFVGNPWSGFTSAPEMLPRAVGTIGKLLPPGAGGSLLRSVAFFDGNGAGGRVLVLTGWAVAGVAGICAGAFRAKRRTERRLNRPMVSAVQASVDGRKSSPDVGPRAAVFPGGTGFLGIAAHDLRPGSAGRRPARRYP